MMRYRFYGIEVLHGCQAMSNAAVDLVKEECHWVCKHSRPFARCSWKFDPDRKFESLRGPLQTCWFQKTCTGSYLEVYSGCNPMPPRSSSNEAGLTELDDKLSQAIAAHSVTRENLTAAQQELDTTQ